MKSETKGPLTDSIELYLAHKRSLGKELAKVEPMPKTGGKWNVYEITAKGPQFTVILNGQKTVDGVEDSKFTSGRIALQYGAGAVKDKGVVKFRKVEIKPL